MEKIKFTLMIIALVISNVCVAQKSLFKALETNGEEATYTAYNNVRRVEGKYSSGTKGATVRLEIKRTNKGVPIGVHIRDVVDNKRIAHATEEYKQVKMDHYPLPIMIRDTYDNKAFVVIDDMAFFISKMQNDGSFDEIKTIYVLNKTGSEKKETKKKKGFFNKIKTAVNDTYGSDAGKDENQKKFTAMDLDIHITNYWNAMKTIQSNYMITMKDKAERNDIDAFRVNKYKNLNKRNDSILKNDERYRRAYEDYKKGGVANGQVSLVNTSNSEVLIISGASNTSKMKIGRGQSKNWNCMSDAFIGVEQNNGSSVTYRTLKKIYSANSKCEGKVSF